MSSFLSRHQIGQRIATLRKLKGLSQEELASNIDLSRPSLVQVELGNRGIDILELQKISHVLGFSIDDLLAQDFMPTQNLMVNEEVVQYKVERIAKPSLQMNKLRNILLYILERCAGKPNVGDNMLNNLLYFADFNHYEFYEEQLSGATYLKLPYGPVPLMLDLLYNQMIENKQLKRIKTNYLGQIQIRYLPLKKADLTAFKASEKVVIDKVIDQMSDWSADAISDYVTGDIPWLASKAGEVIDYELVFYRELPYSVRNYESEIQE